MTLGAGNFNEFVRPLEYTRVRKATGYVQTSTLGDKLRCSVTPLSSSAPPENQSTGKPQATHQIKFNRRVEPAYARKRFQYVTPWGETLILKPVRPVFVTNGRVSVIDCEVDG